MALSVVDYSQIDPQALQIELEAKIKLGEKLLSLLCDKSKVRGCQKLLKRLQQETNFLRKVLEKRDIKIEHVKCTNLGHLEALVNCVLEHCDGCSAILETLELRTGSGDSKRVCVDIIADQGQTWIKVVARNPKALSLLSAGEGEYGQRTVTDQAKEFLACASQHPYHFKIPRVAFFFASGIELPLANTLEKLGIEVRGERVENENCLHAEDSEFDDASNSDQDCGERYENYDDNREYSNNVEVNDSSRSEERLNLDVTAMIAYVSSLTNGGCHFKFKEPLLTQQAEWERERPAKPLLDKAFQGRELFCCSTAYKDFQSIIATLGGPAEKKRAEILLQRISVVPDQISKRTDQYLKEGGKVKARSRKIFGTGDELRAITVTANEGFVRAAKSQGLSYAVLVHESRALSESKEASAEPT
ncbi:UPF0415 protein C7orf25 homolog [Frankliniella occidentalis]|uniref:UPF0415 protein C7orf25 homolog n=1 Tax=Frankliniella occidentalis TaxID=133901 RepID=A0A9C6XDW2_FRAOC|nr:UPF0415 protein C7orf25 homolog [Frankliniella occidentalis]